MPYNIDGLSWVYLGMTTTMIFDNHVELIDDDNCEHLIDDNSHKGEDDAKAWEVFYAAKAPIIQTQGLHILNMTN